MEHWIRLHWFELSALVLLGLNLWFVIKVLSVLKAVQDGLILLARWLPIDLGSSVRHLLRGRCARRLDALAECCDIGAASEIGQALRRSFVFGDMDP